MKELFVSGDIGATQMRVAVFDIKAFAHSIIYDETIPEDYEGSVQKFADLSQAAAEGKGEIVAASTAVAASVDRAGVLTVSGALNGWIGKNLKNDVADALGIPHERSGAMNDVEAIACSQRSVNSENGRHVAGYAATLSSGFGGARYHQEGVESDEPGHEYLKDGADCPCGQHGHVEAHISGKGVLLNHHVAMKDWLKSAENAATLVTDISDAVVALIERHRNRDDFEPEEIKWTGGVALNQPFVMQRVLGRMKEKLDGQVPSFGRIDMGDQAGLHGTFMDALMRAICY